MASTATNVSCILSPQTAVEAVKVSARPAQHTLRMPALPMNAFARAGTAIWRRVSADVVTETVRDEPETVAVTPSENAGELQEFINTVKDAWDKVEDKIAVASLAVSAAVALCATSGMMSAVDKLPLVPGALELVGIGYTGWFAYRNLLYKPDRDALIAKMKRIYDDII